jgi:hypothetical protein
MTPNLGCLRMNTSQPNVLRSLRWPPQFPPEQLCWSHRLDRDSNPSPNIAKWSA